MQLLSIAVIVKVQSEIATNCSKYCSARLIIVSRSSVERDGMMLEEEGGFEQMRFKTGWGRVLIF